VQASQSITVQQLAKAIGAPLSRAKIWHPLLVKAMQKWGIDTPTRQAHFLAQISVESDRLTRLEEGLSYSAERLMVVWPSRFKTLEQAAQYTRNPEKLANFVYSGRMGNQEPGDGWKYRGRGLKQLTGKQNYITYLLSADIDCLENPDMILQPEHTSDSAAWFWYMNRCNELADKGNVRLLTRRINGGLTGLSARMAQTNAALKALKALKPTEKVT
jgi:putative chitinase